MDLNGMDPETAKIAVQLQIADIDDLLDSLYSDEDLPEGDSRTSYHMMREDLRKQLPVIEGQILSLKVLRADHENRVAFSRYLAEERQAASDHRMAMELDGMALDHADIQHSVTYEAALPVETDNGIDTQWQMAMELYPAASELNVEDRSPLNGIRTTKANPSESKAPSKVLGSKALTKCMICMEVVTSSDTISLPCKGEVHTYCRPCLVNYFKTAMANPSQFPPQCCGSPIPIDTCRELLPKELVKKFDLKVEELATPNPTYCWNAECSEFIRSANIKDSIATCPFCHEKTSTCCKNKAHTGLCPSDPHVQLLMDVAKRSKWQQCTKCNNMVELAQGCFHMTCKCKHHFCYLCGKKWKTCLCPKWEESYLSGRIPLPAAPAIMAPVPTPPLIHMTRPARLTRPTPVTIPTPLIPRPTPTQRTAHEHDWEPVIGPLCQFCGAHDVQFVMHCAGCNTHSCWQCIVTRL